MNDPVSYKGENHGGMMNWVFNFPISGKKSGAWAAPGYY